MMLSTTAEDVYYYEPEGKLFFTLVFLDDRNEIRMPFAIPCSNQVQENILECLNIKTATYDASSHYLNDDERGND